MAVKLTKDKKDVKSPEATQSAAPAQPTQPAAPAQKPAKPKVTCGVFMVTNADKSFKYIGTSSRIEICWKDYSKWLADKKHANTELQAAYDKANGNLTMTILEECPRENLSDAKKKHCKEQGVDMRVPFSKEIIKASDIK